LLPNDRTYELGDLASFVDLSRIRRWECYNPIPKADEMGIILDGSRNSTVFDYGRKYAYGQIRSCSTHKCLLDKVAFYCSGINSNCHPPLTEREVFHIARSIAKYCWERREALASYARNRGALGFGWLPSAMDPADREEEIRHRRSLGASYTNALRRRRTESAIIDAIGALKASNRRITKAAVARLVGVSRIIVSRQYSHLFPEV
jgi:hypothetical protein